MGDLRHELARGRDGFVVDHVGLGGGWAKTETPITLRRSRFAKDLREGTLDRIEALQRRADFVLAHGVARTRFLAGERDVVWPFGTWLMRVRLGLPCENAPP